jgi:hypothetical protein
MSETATNGPAKDTPGGNGKLIRRDFEDFLSSPILTQEVDLSGPTPATGGGGGAAGGSSGRVAAAAVRKVLGYRPRPGDTKGFVAALNTVFTAREADGYTKFTWTPRTYATEVQTDFGALTGAQASLYTRAKAALDLSLPLLDGLTPLVVTANPEDYEPTRATARTLLIDLVSELGVLGGPRVSKVDNAFLLLLGVTPPHPVHTPSVGGKLSQLGTQLGMAPGNVNDIAQEQNLTNYLVLVDYIVGLYMNWLGLRVEFGRTRVGKGDPNGAYLGTQLVLISQALASITESVQECYFVMDSVFLGPAERQIVVLDFSALIPDPQLPPLTLAEFLDWVASAVGTLIPQVMDDGGKEGVITANQVLTVLANYAAAAAALSGSDTPPSTKFGSVRVNRELQDLAQELTDAVNLTAEIRRNPPRIDPHLSQFTIDAAAHVSLTMIGVGFQPGARVTVAVSDNKYYDPTTAPARILDDRTLAANLTLRVSKQPKDPAPKNGVSLIVTVTNPDLQTDTQTLSAPGQSGGAPGKGFPPAGGPDNPAPKSGPSTTPLVQGMKTADGAQVTLTVSGQNLDLVGKAVVLDLKRSHHVAVPPIQVPPKGATSFTVAFNRPQDGQYVVVFEDASGTTIPNPQLMTLPPVQPE